MLPSQTLSIPFVYVSIARMCCLSYIKNIEVMERSGKEQTNRPNNLELRQTIAENTWRGGGMLGRRKKFNLRLTV